LLSKQPYPSRETIHFIKQLGTLPIEKSKSNENITVVVQHMKQYPDSISMQRVCCHTISNMSMDTEIANEVVINRVKKQNIFMFFFYFCLMVSKYIYIYFGKI
jgi:hypothetical protein